MSAGISMHAMTRNVPPHTPQCSMSMWKTRLSRCIQRMGAWTRTDDRVDEDLEMMLGYFPVLRERLCQAAGTRQTPHSGNPDVLRQRVGAATRTDGGLVALMQAP